MITVYGIPNCDTCRKARKWLTEHDIDHVFHDVRKDGLHQDQVESWIGSLGWETLLNRRGTTWRTLPDVDKAGLDARAAAVLMTANPTLIKRPVFVGGDVFEGGDNVLIGFSAESQAALTAFQGVTA